MDKRQKGGQRGNTNAPRAKHKRLAVSFSGTLLERVYEALAEQGETEPTQEQVKAFILDVVDRQVK